MRIALTSILVCAVVAMIGCSNTNTPPSSTAFNSVSQWIYSDETFDSSGTSIASSVDTVTIRNTSGLHSDRYDSLSDNSILRLDNSSGSWILKSLDPNNATCSSLSLDDRVGDTEFVIGPVPLKVDDSIYVLRLACVMRSADESVVTHAGVFDCIEYELKDVPGTVPTHLKETYYISPSVGLVLQESYMSPRNGGPMFLRNRKELQSVR